MSVFDMGKYAVVISIIIFITAFIPIIGPVISFVAGEVLLLLDGGPWHPLIFLILFLVLQQAMASFIYPRVVGKATGLPSIWVLGAVILGSRLMGILGALLFIPLCSVLYSLFRVFVRERLASRKPAGGIWPPSAGSEPNA